MPFGNREKNILEDLFNLVLSQFTKNIPPPWKPDFFFHFQKLIIAYFNGEKSFQFLLS